MAKKSDERRSYPVNINFFVDKCRNIDSAGLRVNLKSENPTPDGGVWFRILHGMSAASYGEKITVTLTPTPSGTDVHVLSECGMPTQLIDYGKNKSNVQAVFGYLEAGMPAGGMYAAPQYSQPQPQQYSQPQAPQPQPAPADAQRFAQQQFNQTPVQQYAQAPQPQPAPAQQVFYCPQCGRPHNADANFCGGCGTRLK